MGRHAVYPRALTRLTTLVALAALPAAAGCRARDTVRRLVGAEGSRAAVDSLIALRNEVEYLRAASAERDTLLQQVRETQDFIDSVDTDLTRLAGPDTLQLRLAGEGVDSEPPVRELMRRRIQLVAERLARNEAEARERAERLRDLARRNDVLEARVAELDSSVVRFREIVQGQQEQIASLLARVDTLESEKAQLTAERGALADSVQRLTARADSVFVIAASRQELLRLGVVVEEGGTRVPLVGRLNTVIVPARAPRDRLFAVLDRRHDLVIRLPNGDRPYRIVSSHDPALLDPAQPGNPVVRGVLRIADPDRFWATSRYLVLVEE
ncbi:hypothetical protein J421_0387 [Gemmatirosa kalamazoonensis]|uniref:Uncharacterized protein n=1 Tax=Gemmatirosa kalamazoonensis TaxID=861299 RepID=W0R9Y6_9BACT|nr:hypothetical protein [Gemmatirosa kalamazoonensis]AHG87924.1 hypothetical protein J421_0387 [Gemmatirosa kalamazoonensis]